MGNRTKIVVLRLKEIIYTGIFVFLGILFIVLLIIMFFPEKKTAPSPASQASESLYRAGIYRHTLTLGSQTVDIAVTVDENNINSIEIVNLDETAETMYPLLEPSFKNLVGQIISSQSLDGITYSEESKYTSLVLLEGIREALAKADSSSDSAENPSSEPGVN